MKARIQYTGWIEFELKPENYPEGCTPEQMLAIDLQQMNEDSGLFFELYSAMDNSFEITGDLLP